MAAPPRTDFFVAGGTLSSAVPSYVQRPADQELFDQARAGRFCYVLTTRQMGKSSLMIRTKEQLKAEGVHTAVIDLTELGTTEVDTWYLDLVVGLSEELSLTIDPEQWWQKQGAQGVVRRFTRFLREVVLTELAGQVVIFIDEIDFTLKLDFRDDFFAAIRAMYNNRAKDPTFERLTFVLLGVASPADLIKDPSRTPFNIGYEIKLKEFDEAAAQVFEDRLEALFPGSGATIFKRVFHWTNGHPYLTQKICVSLVNGGHAHWTEAQVDQLVNKIFLTEEASRESNLQFVRERVLRSPDKARLLTLYQQVYEGKVVKEDERSLVQNELRLYGLLRVEGRVLKIRNEIYHQVFNTAWIEANLPVKISEADFFVAGGTLRPEAPSYLKRPADDELFAAAYTGEFCYVLTARQMGKSSLMIRTARRLRAEGISSVIIDLTKVGIEVSANLWYFGLLIQLKNNLRLSVDLDQWWDTHRNLGGVQRFTEFIREIVLQEIAGKVVIFMDEIDTTLNLPFSDDFFAAIRYVYNARATDPIYEDITFVLLGVAIPADLIKDRSRTPFNIGQGIDLTDFNLEDADILLQGLKTIYPEQGQTLFDRIFYWTGGHPYLTQKLCLSVAESGIDEGAWTSDRIDQLIEKLFLSKEARKETNLQFVRDYVQNSPHKQRLMGLYRQVYSGKVVPEDERSLYQNQLKLFGLVKVENNTLAVRNEIYRRVFNAEWIKANTPVDWTRRIAIVAILMVLLLVGVISLIQWQGQQSITDQAQAHIDNFRTTTSTDVRLTSLAGLYDLPGYDDQANELFFDELSREERLALLNEADPTVVGSQLITVIKALSPQLENNERDNAMLQTMVAPLEKIDDVRAGTLATEIKQWQQGRQLHNAGEYEQAVTVYDLVSSLNDRNPGLYFDRGLAYAALNEPRPALADFEIVLRLDESRQTRVEQVILSDPLLYETTIAAGKNYPALVALIPTPTNTPTATRSPTATPSPTPSPTATPTDHPATATLLPVATTDSSSSTAVAEVPTATPTPRPATVVYVQSNGATHNLGIVSSAGVLANANLHQHASAPTWSPDGSRLAFYGEPGISTLGDIYAQGIGVWVIDIASGALDLLYAVDHIHNMTWSLDGNKLALEVGAPGVTRRIFVISAETGEEITRFPGEQPAWSPTGQELVIKSCAPECGLWRAGLDGVPNRLLTPGSTDSYPTWSPDGRFIVYTSRSQTGDWEIYRLELETNTVLPLTTRPGTDTTPIFSSDGREIYFRTDAYGAWRVMAMAVDGTNERLVQDNVGASDDWGLARPAVK